MTMVAVDVSTKDVDHVIHHLLTCPGITGGTDDMSRVMTLFIAAHALGAYFFGPPFSQMVAAGQIHIDDAVKDRVETWKKTAAEMRGRMI